MRYHLLWTVALVVLLVGAGCSTPPESMSDQGTNAPAAGVEKTTSSSVSGSDTATPEEVTAPAAADKTPQITSAIFDGNGIVIQGKNLSGSSVAFVHPSPNGQTLCREMITPNPCVLQKKESTDTTIAFMSNWIGGAGSYEVYVEHPKTGVSNKVKVTIQ